MPLSYLLGMAISNKIFNKTLAILRSKVYNTLILVRNLAKKVAKGFQKRGNNAGRKNEKVNSFVSRNGSVTTIYTAKHYGLSNDSHKKHTWRNRRFKSTNRPT